MPISPNQVDKTKVIPKEIFDVFDFLIQRNFNGRSATVYQEDVVRMLLEKDFDRNDIFNNKWLDVESVYSKAGWKVKYDQPCYWGGENFRAYWEFTSIEMGIVRTCHKY